MSIKDVLFVCIGTKKSMGDSVAPRIGTALKQKGYNVLGCMHDNVMALNYIEQIKRIPEGITVVAIDACIVPPNKIGEVLIQKEGIKAASGVGKDLPRVGDLGIKVCVSEDCGIGYISSIRLNKVPKSFVNEMVVKTLKIVENELIDLLPINYYFEKIY